MKFHKLIQNLYRFEEYRRRLGYLCVQARTIALGFHYICNVPKHSDMFSFRALYITVILFFIASGISGQDLIFGGTVKTMSGLLLENAAVIVLNPADSTVIYWSETSPDGRYEIGNVRPGRYLLRVQHIACQDYKGEIDLIAGLTLDIELTEKDIALEAIRVRPDYIKRRADGYTVDIRHHPVAAGRHAMEVFNILPGVISFDDKLMLNGRAFSKIYIDGREIKEYGELEGLMAEDIDEIDIQYTEGSAGDARSRGGIMNITLKKLANGGLYGSLSGTLNMATRFGFNRHNEEAIFSYNTPKFSFYNYLRYSDFRVLADDHIHTDYFDTGSRVDQNVRDRTTYRYVTESFNIAYRPSESHRLGFYGSYYMRHGKPETRWDSQVTPATGDPYVLRTIGSGKDNVDRLQAAFDYQWKIDGKGSQFRLTADYLRYDADIDNRYENRESSGSMQQINYSRERDDKGTDMYAADGRFTLVLNDSWRLGFGGKSYRHDTENPISFSSTDVTDMAYADHLRIRSTGYAGYMTLAAETGPLSLKGGVRFQQDNIDYRSSGGRNKKWYGYWYPSAELSIEFDEDGEMVLTVEYEKELFELPHHELNPGVRYESEFFYSRGNPDLAPSLSHLISVIQSVNDKWNFYYEFEYQKDGWQFVNSLDPDNDLVIFSMPVNSASFRMHSAGLDLTQKLWSWWTIVPQFRWTNFKARYRGEEARDNYRSNKYAVYISNMFNFKNDWAATLNVQFEPRYFFDNQIYYGVGYVRGSVSKYFFDKKLNARLSADIYTRNRNIGIKNYQYRSLERNLNNNVYFFGLNIAYRFVRGRNVKVERGTSLQEVTIITEK